MKRKSTSPSALIAVLAALQRAFTNGGVAGLSPSHMRAFLVVATAKTSAVPTQAITDALRVSGARVSQILGRLGAGWEDDSGYDLIEYRRNRRADRRGKFVMLSPAGVALAEKLELNMRGHSPR